MTLIDGLSNHGFAVLVLTLVALFLFSRPRLPIETSSLLILAILIVGFSIFPYESNGKAIDTIDFFNGLSNEALIAISALMMASESLVRTGALAPVGRLVSRYWNRMPMVAFLLVLASTALVSAFMNNTPQVVLMIPLLIGVAIKTGLPSSGMLMPMTFSAQIGGTMTPIGTSLNLLVIASAASLGIERFGMFDFALPALIAGSAGVLFLWLVAPRLLPHRDPRLPDVSPRLFTAQLQITENSAADGKTLLEATKESGVDVRSVSIIRPPGLHIAALPDVVLRAGDQLMVKDTPDKLKELERVMGATLYVGQEQFSADNPPTDKGQQLAELVVTRNSGMAGRTLNDIHLDEFFRIVPLALHHEGQELLRGTGTLHNTPLSVGDVVLVQGDRERIAEIRTSGEMLVLDATSDLPETSKAPLALLIMLGIVLLVTFKVMPVASSAMLGVLAMILTGCLNWRTALHALDSQMIFLTVASIALSFAMVHTGAAQFLADLFAQSTQDLSGPAIVSGLMLFMAILSNIISNNAAAVIGTPIAIKIAENLSYSPEAFVLAVLFGVNMSYSTPMADNCNLLVYSAGGYKFTDFMRVGIPLTLIMWMMYSFLLPHFFPL